LRGPQKRLPRPLSRDRESDLQRELGRLEGRLELTEAAESTLREQLERERARADRLEEELRDARVPLLRHVNKLLSPEACTRSNSAVLRITSPMLRPRPIRLALPLERVLSGALHALPLFFGSPLCLR
jgi:hypothetical protein